MYVLNLQAMDRNYTIEEADSRGADLNARMLRLVCAFTARVFPKAGFSHTWSTSLI